MKKIRAVVLILIFIVSAVTLAACNESASGTVEFIVDGKVYATVPITKDGSFKLPEMPTRDGKAFSGWYYDEDRWEKLFDTRVIPSKSTRVYARWLEGYEYDGMMKYYVKEDYTYLVIIEPYEPIISVTVPAGRHGMPVTEVGYVSGYDKSYVSSIVEINLPLTLTKIGDRAFSGFSALRQIDIPDGVTEIGEYAFSKCGELRQISLGSKIDRIGNYAFELCGKVDSVYIDDVSAWCRIKMNSSDANPMHNGAKLYLNGEELSSLVIPEQISELGFCAFKGCTSLTSVSIPGGFTYIDSSAFNGCANIKEYTVSAENRIYKAKDGNLYSYDGRELVAYAVGKEDREFTVPDGVRTICTDAFSYGENLESIIIPEGVEIIEGGAFEMCKNLCRISLPKSLREIGNFAFYFTALKKITVPENCSYIGGSVFGFCKSLTEIEFEDCEGWYVTDDFYGSLDRAGGTEADVSDSAANANVFTDINENRYWYKLE